MIDRRRRLARPDRWIRANLRHEEARVETLWRVIVGASVLLAIAVLARSVAGAFDPLDMAALALLVALALALLGYRRLVATAAARWRESEESSKRFLAGLSRSVSSGSIVEALVEELRTASRADHVVVARLRQDDRLLETTLVSGSGQVPAATTLLAADPPGGRLPTDESDGPAFSVPVMDPSVVRLSAGVPDRRMSAAASAARIGRSRPLLIDPPIGEAAPSRPTGEAAPSRPTRNGASRPEAHPSATAERIAAVVRRAYGFKHTLAAPLLAQERVIGALVLSRRTGDRWSPGTRLRLAWAAEEASAALARAYAHEAAEVRANIDALTGLPNRRYLDELADVLSSRRRRVGDAIGALMVDIDHFKGLNDRYGHATGDLVLRRVAGAIATTVRADDLPARYGGEEFAVVLRRATPEQALDVAERLRQAVASLPLREMGIEEPVSVSVGVAVAEGSEAPLNELVAAADRALYAAKRAGRDRVVVA
ncbi:MAG TPA: diguanylate cyclase [Candidatus Limnocylindrales bacterium]|nr:diguanylate cyclase [Candidatus Limnocylindrales bacterium]